MIKVESRKRLKRSKLLIIFQQLLYQKIVNDTPLVNESELLENSSEIKKLTTQLCENPSENEAAAKIVVFAPIIWKSIFFRNSICLNLFYSLTTRHALVMQ